jgi:hypothetical protein
MTREALRANWERWRHSSAMAMAAMKPRAAAAGVAWRQCSRRPRPSSSAIHSNTTRWRRKRNAPERAATLLPGFGTTVPVRGCADISPASLFTSFRSWDGDSLICGAGGFLPRSFLMTAFPVPMA